MSLTRPKPYGFGSPSTWTLATSSRVRCAVMDTVTRTASGWLTRCSLRSEHRWPNLSHGLSCQERTFRRSVTGRSAPDGVPLGSARGLGSGRTRRGDGRLRRVAMGGRPPRHRLANLSRGSARGHARRRRTRGGSAGGCPRAGPRPRRSSAARSPASQRCWLTPCACPVRLRLGGGADGLGPIGGGPIGGGSRDGAGARRPIIATRSGRRRSRRGRGLLPGEVPGFARLGVSRSAPSVPASVRRSARRARPRGFIAS